MTGGRAAPGKLHTVPARERVSGGDRGSVSPSRRRSGYPRPVSERPVSQPHEAAAARQEGAFRYEPDMEGIRGDVESLSAMSRSSLRQGERESAAWLAGRLREIGLAEVQVEPYAYQHSYALAHGAHNMAGLAACALGGAVGAALAAATLWSYEQEVSGARQWLRRLLPRGQGANVVARIPAARRSRGTLVLLAHHDAANSGLVWDPRLVASGAERHLRRRRVDPFMAPLELALLLAAAGSLMPRRAHAGRGARAVAAAILAVATAVDANVGSGATVPGASDNASGVAACIDLARALSAEPPLDADIILALVGGEEAGMGGMASFLDSHGDTLRSGEAFVLGLDTLGAGTPIVCTGEGAMREQRYREGDVALVEHGARIAGAPPPERWRIGAWTDPILAVHRGIPSASVLSMGPGYFPHYHHPTDLPEHVDWASVAACSRIAAGTISAFAARLADPAAGSPG